ncbi:MAG: RyR domain-containing protein [Alphaproteobacteria bacterium]|nr:RyR domain-containing protein [Alphaproteobacteria bacterium]
MAPKSKDRLDTNAVELNQQFLGYVEVLAAHIHHNWLERRVAEGWGPGKQRNDDRMTHPCIKPYSALPESEKEYDRESARETLKALLALGCRITGPAG